MNPTESILFSLVQVALLSLGMLVFFYIIHKQKVGDWRGIPSLPRALAFCLFVFAAVILFKLCFNYLLFYFMGAFFMEQNWDNLMKRSRLTTKEE